MDVASFLKYKRICVYCRNIFTCKMTHKKCRCTEDNNKCTCDICYLKEMTKDYLKIIDKTITKKSLIKRINYYKKQYNCGTGIENKSYEDIIKMIIVSKVVDEI